MVKVMNSVKTDVVSNKMHLNNLISDIKLAFPFKYIQVELIATRIFIRKE